MRPPPPAAEFRTTFDLTKVDGEWRIEDLPQGLLLSQSDVDRAFRSFSVYFFNPAFETLVPDPRMVPVIGPGLATTLVRRLVAGPSDWLQPAVENNPVSILVDAVRSLMVGDPHGGSIVTVLVISGVFVAVFGPLTMRAYSRRS